MKARAVRASRSTRGNTEPESCSDRAEPRENCAGVASAALREGSAGSADGALRESSESEDAVADGVAPGETEECGDSLPASCPADADRGGDFLKDGEKDTNEPNVDEEVTDTQNQISVEVTANSGDIPRLDKLQTNPRAACGRKEGEIRNSKSETAGRSVNEPAGADRVSSVAEAIASLHAAVRLETAAEVPDASRLVSLAKMEQMLFKEMENLETRGEPVDDLLTDLLASSAGLHAYSWCYQPRSP
jgi:hypothetical protein